MRSLEFFSRGDMGIYFIVIIIINYGLLMLYMFFD